MATRPDADVHPVLPAVRASAMGPRDAVAEVSSRSGSEGPADMAVVPLGGDISYDIRQSNRARQRPRVREQQQRGLHVGPPQELELGKLLIPVPLDQPRAATIGRT
eukprot:398048-Pyramimonas_sp.AAC.1